jgi:N6-adenosine-specific RNA methylase IME4
LTLYRTIVVDPPWPYPAGFGTHVGGRRRDGTASWQREALPYGCLSLDEIKALPVAELAMPDAWVWLWATNRYLRDAFDVVAAWGFTYGQTVVWHKNDGHPRFPVVIAPNRAEYLLVCRRGHPERRQPWPSNVVEIPFNPQRLAHSQKPDAFLDLIEQVCPGPYLELFARRQRLGWDTWGDEALEHVEMPA